MECKITYFETPGKINTDEVLRIAKERAEELRIKTIVIASSSGKTGVKAVNYFKGMKVVIVRQMTGVYAPDVQEMKPENEEIIKSKGGIIVTTTHTFAGLHRAWKNKTDTFLLGEIMASTLRVFGDGLKVACEISMMAADGGVIRCDEDVICIAGSHAGSDTAIVLKPVNSQRFFSLKIKELLCKPLVPVDTVMKPQKL
jgi:uncharacterized protein